MKRVYFAGPLFCAAELEFNLKISDILENMGYSVFLPQRDGMLAAMFDNLTDEEKVKIIFDKDTEEIKKSDVLFMILDGRVPDEGACVELGIAHTLGKKCYGFKTDARALENGLDINPLLAGCFTEIISDTNGEKAIEKLKDYLKNNEL